MNWNDYSSDENDSWLDSDDSDDFPESNPPPKEPENISGEKV